eukprot:GCRY01006343.1.p1 GENE.GCRY01006343.1~~GCRY01006343.1.p1  ORF type:complete len:2093 (+),score=184.11 GCRY01006343.1:282-6560(+)
MGCGSSKSTQVNESQKKVSKKYETQETSTSTSSKGKEKKEQTEPSTSHNETRAKTHVSDSGPSKESTLQLSSKYARKIDLEDPVLTLSSFVPKLLRQDLYRLAIQEKLLTTYSRPFIGAVVIVDISGFTTLLEQLKSWKRWVRWPGLLSAYFGSLVQDIEDYGGDVLKFTGDSVIAVWPAEDDDQETMSNHVRTACSCCLHLMKAHGGCRPNEDEEIVFNLHMGVSHGVGDIVSTGSFQATDARMEYILCGPVLDQAGNALKHSKLSQICICNQTANLIEGIKTLPLEKTEDFLLLEEENYALKYYGADNEGSTSCYAYTYEILPEMEVTLSCFVPRHIRTQIRNTFSVAQICGSSAGWASAVTTLTTLFINFANLPNVEMLHNAVETIFHFTKTMNGFVRQVAIDEKGSTCVLIFGLEEGIWGKMKIPPAVQAISTAFLCLTTLNSELRITATAGITTGRVYVGTVGNSNRREHMVVGSPVNTAARLMEVPHLLRKMKTNIIGDRIVLDAKTKVAAAHSAFDITFSQGEVLSLRGLKKDKMVFFVTSIDTHTILLQTNDALSRSCTVSGGNSIASNLSERANSITATVNQELYDSCISTSANVEPDSSKAAQEAVAELRANGRVETDPVLCLLYVSVAHNVSAVLQTVRRLLPHTLLLGGSSSGGVITDKGYFGPKSVGMWGLWNDVCEIEAGIMVYDDPVMKAILNYLKENKQDIQTNSCSGDLVYKFSKEFLEEVQALYDRCYPVEPSDESGIPDESLPEITPTRSSSTFYYSTNNFAGLLQGIPYPKDPTIPLASPQYIGGVIASRRALAQVSEKNCCRQPMLALVFSSPGVEEHMLVGVQSEIGTEVRIVGGTVGDDSMSGQWFTILSEHISTNAVVVALMYGHLNVVTEIVNGYLPTAHSGVLTKARVRTAYEIDHRPAAEVYNEWTGGALQVALGQARDNQSVNITVVENALTSYNPLGIKMSVDRLNGCSLYGIKSPAVLSPDKSITFYACVDEGERITLMTGTRESIAQQYYLHVGELHRRVKEQEMVNHGGFFTFCSVSQGALGMNYLDKFAHELSARMNAPFLGVWCLGEQGIYPLSTENGPLFQSLHGNLSYSPLLFVSPEIESNEFKPLKRAVSSHLSCSASGHYEFSSTESIHSKRIKSILPNNTKEAGSAVDTNGGKDHALILSELDENPPLEDDSIENQNIVELKAVEKTESLNMMKSAHSQSVSKSEIQLESEEGHEKSHESIGDENVEEVCNVPETEIIITGADSKESIGEDENLPKVAFLESVHESNLEETDTKKEDTKGKNDGDNEELNTEQKGSSPVKSASNHSTSMSKQPDTVGSRSALHRHLAYVVNSRIEVNVNMHVVAVTHDRRDVRVLKFVKACMEELFHHHYEQGSSSHMKDTIIVLQCQNEMDLLSITDQHTKMKDILNLHNRALFLGGISKGPIVTPRGILGLPNSTPYIAAALLHVNVFSDVLPQTPLCGEAVQVGSAARTRVDAGLGHACALKECVRNTPSLVAEDWVATVEKMLESICDTVDTNSSVSLIYLSVPKAASPFVNLFSSTIMKQIGSSVGISVIANPAVSEELHQEHPTLIASTLLRTSVDPYALKMVALCTPNHVKHTLQEETAAKFSSEPQLSHSDSRTKEETSSLLKQSSTGSILLGEHLSLNTADENSSSPTSPRVSRNTQKANTENSSGSGESSSVLEQQNNQLSRATTPPIYPVYSSFSVSSFAHHSRLPPNHSQLSMAKLQSMSTNFQKKVLAKRLNHFMASSHVTSSYFAKQNTNISVVSSGGDGNYDYAKVVFPVKRELVFCCGAVSSAFPRIATITAARVENMQAPVTHIQELDNTSAAELYDMWSGGIISSLITGGPHNPPGLHIAIPVVEKNTPRSEKVNQISIQTKTNALKLPPIVTNFPFGIYSMQSRKLVSIHQEIGTREEAEYEQQIRQHWLEGHQFTREIPLLKVNSVEGDSLVVTGAQLFPGDRIQLRGIEDNITSTWIINNLRAQLIGKENDMAPRSIEWTLISLPEKYVNIYNSEERLHHLQVFLTKTLAVGANYMIHFPDSVGGSFSHGVSNVSVLFSVIEPILHAGDESI